MRLSMKLTPRASRHSSLARSIPPNSMRARRSASSRGIPVRTRSSANASTWKRSTASISRSIRPRPRTASNQERTRFQSFISLYPVTSLIAQRHHRIDFRRSPRRDITRQHYDTDDGDGQHCEKAWFERLHFEKQAGHCTRDGERAQRTGHHPYATKPHSFTDNQPQEVSLARPKRKADAHFPCTLCNP